MKTQEISNNASSTPPIVFVNSIHGLSFFMNYRDSDMLKKTDRRTDGRTDMSSHRGCEDASKREGGNGCGTKRDKKAFKPKLELGKHFMELNVQALTLCPSLSPFLCFAFFLSVFLSVFLSLFPLFFISFHIPSFFFHLFPAYFVPFFLTFWAVAPHTRNALFFLSFFLFFSPSPPASQMALPAGSGPPSWLQGPPS